MNQKEKKAPSALVVVSEILPTHIPIIPIDERPIFPGLPLPLIFNGKPFVKLFQKMKEKEQHIIGLCLTKDPEDESKEEIGTKDLFEVGTAIKVVKIIPMNEETIQVFGTGLGRFEFKKEIHDKPVLLWEVAHHYETKEKPDDELKAHTLSILGSVKDLIKLNPIFEEELRMIFAQVNREHVVQLIDLISSVLTSDRLKLQDLLATFSVLERAKKLMLLLREEIELQSLRQKISKQIEKKISKQQREYYLKEQLKAIKKELGLEKDEKQSELEKIQKKLENKTLSAEAKKILDEKLEYLQGLDPGSPEYSVTLNYLNTLVDLPWGIYTSDKLNIQHAKKQLDQNHYGLDDVKNTILEFIAVLKKREKIAGSSLILVGAPGVGKTSIGKAVAEALGRKFFRFSLGGMRDEAEIKGHRRTYIGAMPGKIIEALRRSESANPVIMLDEIDKMGMSHQGDPGSALLEVLDPEQNENFLDHYLDVRFDLSKVLFIATANQLDTIPAPLLDRMEVVRLSGYILEEKLAIAKNHLIPKQCSENGFKTSEIKISDTALKIMIDRYARESGVRDLELQIRKLIRKIAYNQAMGNTEKVFVTENDLQKYLGKPLFFPEDLYKTPMVGVVLGLAYTSMGGATLYIEATSIKAPKGNFKLTGQLGDVMKESASIAYTVIRKLLPEMSDYFESHEIHLHVPAGATPKDGPSAGVTMALAIHSLVTGKPVKMGIAMTGELTLTGKVLPIGGVKEKAIAAKRVKIKNLYLPKANDKDFEEIPTYIKKYFKVHYLEDLSELLNSAYVSTKTKNLQLSRKQ